MSLAEARIKRAYRIARGALLIAEQMRLDAGAIVSLLPLDDRDRDYTLEVLRQSALRTEREKSAHAV